MITKKIICIFFSAGLMMIPIFCFSAPILATDSTYVKLAITETKTSSGIVFSLQKTEALYGNFSGSYELYDSKKSFGDYILEAYDAKNKLSAKYSLKSGRFVYVDFENGGDFVENNSGTIYTVIAYNTTRPIAYVKINNKGKKTLALNLPNAVLAEQFKKIMACKKVGEMGTFSGNDKCCLGLIPAIQAEGNFVCISCGDGTCGDKEDYYTCPEDCDRTLDSSSVASVHQNKFLASLLTSLKNNISSWIVILFFVAMSIFVAIKYLYKIIFKKKENMGDIVKPL
jgi:hypothetical protein